jgi:glycosyltransferase involved in cell wall biosynthesis
MDEKEQLPIMSHVVIHCGTGGPNYYWDDSTIAQGVGGSEEQVICFSRELTKRSHNVTVLNNCGQPTGFPQLQWISHPTSDILGNTSLVVKPVSSCSVNYIPYDQPVPACDVLIGWRNYKLLQKRYAPIQILWCHDQPVADHCPSPEAIEDGALDNIDAIWVLNAHHRGLYLEAGVPADKLWICEIGVDLTPFDAQIERIPFRCVYLSHPHRGLYQLRRMWPEVRRRVPQATLQACWWEPEHFLPPDESIGLLQMKQLGAADLAHEIMQSEILAYPSVFHPEISPASTIKAQLGGAVPVVIVAGGMRDTVRYGHKAGWGDYAIALANALTDPNWRAAERARMMPWARGTYGWGAVIEKWTSRWLHGHNA